MTIKASILITSGQNLFPIRLETIIVPPPPSSTPDSDVSLKAVCIAPDSDVDILKVTYANPAVPGATTTTTVGVGAPLVGQINALVNVPITFAAGRPFAGTSAFWGGVTANPYLPVLKAFGYFQNPPTLPITRADYFDFRLHTQLSPAEEPVMRQPYYGRRIMNVKAEQAPGGVTAPTTIRVYGWDLLVPGGSRTLLFTGVLNPGPANQVTFDMVNRFFDAIEVTSAGANANDIFAVDWTFADAL